MKKDEHTAQEVEAETQPRPHAPEEWLFGQHKGPVDLSTQRKNALIEVWTEKHAQQTLDLEPAAGWHPKGTEYVIEYQISPPVTDHELNGLFAASWPRHQVTAFQSVLSRSMAYVCAYKGTELVGFVNAAWDGRSHAFVLDTTVHPSFRRMGIGQRLVRCVVKEATKRSVTWVHVDFEPQLREFYSRCGFRPSEAGVVHVATEV